jgi:hypothetical protein
MRACLAVAMRTFFQFIVIVALAVLGWFLYPLVANYLRQQDLLAPAAPKRPPEPVPVAAAAPDPAPAPAPAPTPAPAPAPTPTPAPPAPGSEDLASRIPMPRIAALEEITGNWQAVPQRAFPKLIAIQEDVSFAMEGGNSMKLSAGRELHPLELAADGTLTVAPREGSELRATIAVDKTDFKERVTKRYEEGVERIRLAVEERREAERRRMATEASASDERKAEAGEIPRSSSDQERYLELMRASVAGGELQGVTSDKVRAWRWFGYEEIDGTGYWTGSAMVATETYFGEFETEAKALIRNGRVERWVLPGVEN